MSTNARAAGVACRSRCRTTPSRRGRMPETSSIRVRVSVGSTARRGMSAWPMPAAASPCTVVLSSERNTVRGSTPCRRSCASTRATLRQVRKPMSGRPSRSSGRRVPSSGDAVGTTRTYGSLSTSTASNGPSSTGSMTNDRSRSPASTRGSSSVSLAPSVSEISMSGQSATNRRSTAGRMRAPTLAYVPTRSVPARPPLRAARSACAEATRARNATACRCRALPAGVRPSGRRPGARSRTATPVIFSRAATCWLTAAWVYPSRVAAAPNEPSSTTVASAARCRTSRLDQLLGVMMASYRNVSCSYDIVRQRLCP